MSLSLQEHLLIITSMDVAARGSGCRADAAKLAVALTRCDAEEQQEISEIQYVLVPLFTKFLGA